MPHNRRSPSCPSPPTPNEETRRLFSLVLEELLEVNDGVDSEYDDDDATEVEVAPQVPASEAMEVAPHQEDGGSSNVLQVNLTFLNFCITLICLNNKILGRYGCYGG